MRVILSIERGMQNSEQCMTDRMFGGWGWCVEKGHRQRPRDYYSIVKIICIPINDIFAKYDPVLHKNRSFFYPGTGVSCNSAARDPHPSRSCIDSLA